MNTPAPQPGEKHYDPAYYDAGYYGGGARGGFRDYRYGSQEQAQQLAIKWGACQQVAHESALFIGCALGFEVAYWRARLKRAFGFDVSKYAIDNQIPEAGGNCFLYDGRTLPLADNSVDLIATFDVLPHLPDDMRAALIAEMVRVASAGIAWRCIVKDWRNIDRAVDGQDGAWFHYWRFEELDWHFTKSGKFRLKRLEMHWQYEVTAVYERVKS
jgi:hypothetical protein